MRQQTKIRHRSRNGVAGDVLRVHIVVELNVIQAVLIDRLVETHLHGSTRAEVIKRILDQGLIDTFHIVPDSRIGNKK